MNLFGNVYYDLFWGIYLVVFMKKLKGEMFMDSVSSTRIVSSVKPIAQRDSATMSEPSESGNKVLQGVTPQSHQPILLDSGESGMINSGTVASAEAQGKRIQAEDSKIEDGQNIDLMSESLGSPAVESADTIADVDGDSEIVKEMRESILKNTREISVKLNRSGFKYAHKKNWFSAETAQEAEQFFTVKMPRVMAEELSKVLNEALGLGDESNHSAKIA